MREIIYDRNESFEDMVKRNKENVQKFFANKVEKLKAINLLLKEKKYDEIYRLYGQKAYTFHVPSKYMEADIKNLLKQGNFEDIYAKYGSTRYNKYISKMEAIDIYMETGKKFNGKISSFFDNLRRNHLKKIVANILILQAAPFVLIPVAADNLIQENAEKYASEIINYDMKVSDYANSIRNMELNDIQTFMKVMDDMWKSIDGYGEPKKDIYGLGRLDFLEENGVGVCRNMADDVSAKLNAINEEYNARNLIVTMTHENYRFADIDRKFVNDTSSSNATTNNPDTFENIDITSIFGNHKVVLADIPGENVTVVLDPTNPSLGVIKDGVIHMFSSEDGKGVTVPFLNQLFDGTKASIEYGITVANSFSNQYSFEELRNMYGIDAENRALEEVSMKLSGQKYSFQGSSYSNNYSDSFEDVNFSGKTR